MGCLIVLLGALATYAFYAGGQLVFALITAAVTLINFWSYGVMHNLAVESAKRRPDFSGGFHDFTEGDVNAAPGWATNINLATAVAIVGLLIWSAIQHFR